jgi:hypothetical protein
MQEPPSAFAATHTRANTRAHRHHTVAVSDGMQASQGLRLHHQRCQPPASVSGLRKRDMAVRW